MRVLFVEDDPNLTLLWSALFENRGVEVVQAGSPDAAVMAIGEGRFDLIFLDLYVGLEPVLAFAAALARADPACGLVLITGSDQFDRSAAAAKLPSLKRILRKPVDIEDMAALCDLEVGSVAGGAAQSQRVS